MESKFITTPRGQKLHYLQSGETGPLLVCLHGLGGSTETFVPLFPRLPESYRKILLDFPGFGKSPPPIERPSVARYVADVHHVITHLQGGDSTTRHSNKVVIVGHSLGTVIALHLVAHDPALVSGLALLGPARSASHIPAVRQRMLDMAANTRQNGMQWAAELAARSNFPSPDVRQVDDEIRAQVFKAVASSNDEAYASTCEMMVDEGHKDPDYTSIHCPTVLVAGDLDSISPVERSAVLSELIGTHTCWVEVVKSGHQPILEDLNGVSAAIGRLLDKIQL